MLPSPRWGRGEEPACPSLCSLRLLRSAAIGHEPVELILVPGVPQALEKGEEFPLLFGQALQRLGLVLVESAVAA